jgi:Secretion system C-terminal sorting domain
MKKVFLLLAVGSLAMIANAQELQRNSPIFNNVGSSQASKIANLGNKVASTDVATIGSRHAANRTTTGGGRWYDYADYCSNIWGTSAINAGIFQFWNDSTAVFSNGASAWDTNNVISMGLSLNPMFKGYNDTTIYPGVIKVRSTDNYVIDSVEIFARYNRLYSTPTKIAVVDTLTFSFIYGGASGGATDNLKNYAFSSLNILDTDYGAYTYNLHWLQPFHNNTLNRMDSNGGALPTVYKQYLTSTDSGAFSTVYPVTVPVPAGNAMAMSFSWKTGDAAWHPFDTVQFPSSIKYNDFLPSVFYKGTATTASFPTPYDSTAYMNGYFLVQAAGWGYPDRRYETNFDFVNDAAGTTASMLQYPEIRYHVTCSTCPLTNTVAVEEVHQGITGVIAAPNPASGELTVSFELAAAATTTVSLTNLLGQTVAVETVANTYSGSVVFNTATLPSGIYVYTVQANGGARTTGRVVVAH